MKPYCDLDALGKKARRACMKSRCGRCPFGGKCNDVIMEVCVRAFESGYRVGYKARKPKEQ
jgi:hypothetical protein